MHRSICTAGFFASILVLFTMFAAGCTDPNMQVNDAHSVDSRESRLAR